MRHKVCTCSNPSWVLRGYRVLNAAVPPSCCRSNRCSTQFPPRHDANLIMDQPREIPRHFARGPSCRVAAAWLLLLAACFPTPSRSASLAASALTLPFSGFPATWSYTPVATSGAPQPCAGTDWQCITPDTVINVPGELYQAAAGSTACQQLSAALAIWQCGRTLVSAETYTAVRSGQCTRACAQSGALRCSAASAPVPAFYLPLAELPSPEGAAPIY